MKKMLVCFIVAIVFSLMSAGVSLAAKGGQGKGSPVSKAAHKAQSEGLKGRDLAEKVHEAIKERKEGKEEEVAGEEKDEKRKKHKDHRKGRAGKEKKEKEGKDQE